MKKQVNETSVKADNLFWNLKEKMKSVFVNEDGDVNYPLTVAMFSVIILVFGYPILKSIVTTVFGDIQTWWNSNGSTIFNEVPRP
jgi:hypothetical protein